MNRRFLIDAGERVGMTFLEAAVAALIAAGAFNAETGQAALVAGLTAAASVVKTVAAKYIGSRDTASVVPSVVYAGPTEVDAKSAADLKAEHERARDALGITPDLATGGFVSGGAVRPSGEAVLGKGEFVAPAKKAAKPVKKATKKGGR